MTSMNIGDTFSLIAERAHIAEQYIKEKISKETFYAECDRIDKLMESK